MSKINKALPMPAYNQVYNIIKKMIDADEIEESQFLPSESELCKKFDVSRTTIRAALKKLEDTRYIKKDRGKNSVVTKKKENITWRNLEGFASDLHSKNVELTSIVLAAYREIPSARVQKILQLKEGESVFCLKRIRLMGGVKVVLSISYLAEWVNVDYTKIIFDKSTSLKQVWKDHNIKCYLCDERLEAQIPNEEQIHLLGLDENTAIFYRERITYDESERPIEFALCYYNGNYCKYFVEKGRVE